MDDQKTPKENVRLTKEDAVFLCKKYIEQEEKSPGQNVGQSFGEYMNALGDIKAFAVEERLKSESPDLGNDRQEIVEAIVSYFGEILGELGELSGGRGANT